MKTRRTRARMKPFYFTFYFTFGQDHPLRDFWIEIEALNGEIAREKMVEHFGAKWAFQYEEANFIPVYFPGGRAGRVVEATSSKSETPKSRR